MTAPGPFAFFRSLEAVDARRARRWRIAAAAAICMVFAFWMLTAHDGRDLAGKPIGTDFVSFWTAARLTLSTGPAAAYDPATHAAAQTAAFGGMEGYFAFFYPPPFLLLCLPLGMIPYGAALLAWLALTGAAYVIVVARWLERTGRETAMWLLAFPPVLLNVGHGQNGFLTATLLGGGLMMVERRPLIAGALLGALVVKPHLAVLLPVALAARSQWRAFVATGVSASLLCAISFLALGAEAWHGFIAGGPIARRAMEAGLVDPAKMVSIFAALRLIGAPVAAAYMAQAVVALIAAAAVWRAGRGGLPPADQNALIVAATLCVSPFLLDYDLTLMALPLAWAFSRAERGQFLPYEKAAMLAIFIAPLLTRPLAMTTGIPLAPVVSLGLLWLCWRRATLTASPCRRSHAASGR